jgi:hypothetical protein
LPHPLLGRRELGREGVGEVLGVENLPELDFAVAQRRALDPLDGLVHRGDLPDREAGDQLLRLGERAVDHRGAAVDIECDPLALAARLESVTGQHDTRLDELLGEPVHRHELLG